MFKNLILLIITVGLSSCAVHLASTGEKSPDITKLDVGSSRFDIESEIGPPFNYTDLEDGSSMAVYKYKIGDDPSSFRATVWLVTDILFVFMPELIGTPFELTKGKTKNLKVIYNSNYKSTELYKNYKTKN